MKQKSITVITLVIINLILLGCNQENHPTSHSQKYYSSKLAQVITQKVTARTLTHKVSGYGRVKSHNSVVLKALETSQISAIYFQAGQIVKKDQVLVQFDSSEEKAKVARDQAQLDAKKQTWLRKKELVKNGIISQSKYDDSESDYKQALAQLEQSKSNLTELTIRSPFDGVISQTEYHVGDIVKVGDILATLYNPEQLNIEYQLPALQKADYYLDQKVTVYSALSSLEHTQGFVSYVSPNIELGLVSLKAQLSDAKQFSPGQNVKVVQQTRQLLGQVTVPTSSLIRNIQGAQVFIVVNNKARLRDIKVGQYYDGYVQVLSGLSIGEELVINGQNYLRTGQKVEVISAPSQKNSEKEGKLLPFKSSQHNLEGKK
ncbi:efflux RND transporter periplasmic adaptor subunit [Photobacterium angustum]|nr:efflux RND transporter periplasmic adaptor subunit [Photobacterium angustum]